MRAECNNERKSRTANHHHFSACLLKQLLLFLEQCLAVNVCRCEWACVCVCFYCIRLYFWMSMWSLHGIDARTIIVAAAAASSNFFLSQIGRRTFKIYSVGKWVVLHASTCTDSHSANDIGYWNLKLEILLLDAQFRASVSLFHVVVCFSFFLSFSVHINVFVVQFFMLINYRMVEHNTIEW